ncbi:MAG: hypothetical protein MI974_19525 [Chitinophagales bacterium]|nr:hypothetical protein [Chitinophagales bacterium]
MTLFKKVEQEILDNHYKEFDLPKYQTDITIKCILKSFSEFEKGLSQENDEYSLLIGELNQMLFATQHCLEWILNTDSQSKKDGFPPIESILEFVDWGYKYSLLFDLHVAKWKNHISAEVNEAIKTIKFSTVSEKVLQFSQNQLNTFGKISKIILNKIPDEELFKDFQEHKTKKLAISYKLTEKYFNHFNHMILPEVDRDFDLGRYSIFDFIKFHTTFYILCKYLIYDENKKETVLPYCQPKQGLIDFIASVSRIEKQKIDDILSELTFGKRFKNILSNAPFIFKDGMYYFAPRMYSIIEPNRMLIGALNTREENKIYDSLINTIEESWINTIQKELEKSNQFDIMPNKKLKHKGKIIKPDFIIYDDEVIIIIEYKHFIVPVTTSEILNKSKEIEKAVEQLKKYEHFLLQPSVRINKLGNINKKRIEKLVLLRNPMPIMVFDSNVLYCNIFQLEDLVENNISLDKFVDRIRNINSQSMQKDFETNRIKVGSWTYEFESILIRKSVSNK